MTRHRLTLLLIGVAFARPAVAAPAPQNLSSAAAFAQPERLVVLKETHLPEVSEMFVSPAMFGVWRDRATSFQSLAALVPRAENLVGLGAALRVSTALVSIDLFSTLGLRPALGRDFVTGEDAPSKPDVAILSHAFWRDRFGGRTAALGQTLVLDGRPVTIVGVMPPGFQAPFAADVYRPLRYPPEMWASRGAHVIAWVIGRLKPGVGVAQAEKEVAAISSALPSEGIARRWGTRVIPLADHLADLAGPRVKPRGFDPEGAFAVNVTFARDRYTTADQRAAFAQRLVGAVAKVPGVIGAGGTSALPLSGDEWHNGFQIDGIPVPPTYSLGTTSSVTPGYFEVVRVPLLRGRLFDTRDTASARPVAIISERAARRWPAGVEPLGKRIKLYGGSQWLEVVGVVGEVSAAERGRGETQVYQPFAQAPGGHLSVVVRTEAGRTPNADGVRTALRAVDPAQSTSEFRPVSESFIETVAPR